MGETVTINVTPLDLSSISKELGLGEAFADSVAEFRARVIATEDAIADGRPNPYSTKGGALESELILKVKLTYDPVKRSTTVESGLESKHPGRRGASVSVRARGQELVIDRDDLQLALLHGRKSNPMN